MTRQPVHGPPWWDDMARVADVDHDRFSAGWYRSMRDQYRERFPNADARSLDNMDSFVTFAEQTEERRVSS